MKRFKGVRRGERKEAGKWTVGKRKGKGGAETKRKGMEEEKGDKKSFSYFLPHSPFPKQKTAREKKEDQNRLFSLSISLSIKRKRKKKENIQKKIKPRRGLNFASFSLSFLFLFLLRE